MLKLIVWILLSLGVSGAVAFEATRFFHGPWHEPHPGHTVAAPEIDPASVLSGLTLLVGTLAALRGRRAVPKK